MLNCPLCEADLDAKEADLARLRAENEALQDLLMDNGKRARAVLEKFKKEGGG
jgi:hypothetical protein